MSFLITIIASKSNVYGIAKDVEGISRALGKGGYIIRHCDPLEGQSYTDVAIHLEVPSLGWAAWAATNILVVNPEWFVMDAWKPYLDRFDHIIVKDSVTEEDFVAFVGATRVKKILWAMPPIAVAPKMPPVVLRNEFLWVLGASKTKRAYVPTLLAAWKPSYPNLAITSVTPLDLSGIAVLPNVTVYTGDISAEHRAKIATEYRGHVCCSQAEGFGYTAAEASAVGAFMILNSLPAYLDTYKGAGSSVAFIPSRLERSYFDMGAPVADLQVALDAAMVAFSVAGSTNVTIKKEPDTRWTTFTRDWDVLVRPYSAKRRPAPLKFLPPKLDIGDCPQISVVTLIYNRKKFFDLACHSMMVSDYPKDKIEWIIVDDSDDPMEQNSDRIVAVSEASAPMSVVYVPLRKKTPVSEKRNLGVERATSDIILFVDDDDHYPETSFRRRVAWLILHPWKPQVVAATTIACYDLLKGISAVNVPPMDLPVSQRISEATLTFYKGFWEEKKFPKNIVVGEGEEFIQGRESQFLEIPPQQVIVAFSHGKNVSSRRVPSDPDAKPSCFWGFPKQFLEFIHGLAGVTITTG